MTIGPILTPQAVNPQLVTHCLLSGNTLANTLGIGPGTCGILVRRNTIRNTPGCIDLQGSIAAFPNLSIGAVTIDGNTLVNSGSNGQAIIAFAGWGTGCTVTNNTYNESQVVIGPTNWFSSAVKIFQADESGFTFSNNVWGLPASFSYQLPQTQPFKMFYVGPSDGNAAAYTTVPAGDSVK